MVSKRIATRLVAAVALAAAFASPLSAEPSRSYKNPETGADCVTVTGQRVSDTHVEIQFHNSCQLRLVIEYETTTGKSGSNGFDDHGDSSFTLALADNIGFSWWVR